MLARGACFKLENNNGTVELLMLSLTQLEVEEEEDVEGLSYSDIIALSAVIIVTTCTAGHL